ncbi:MAG TPA: CHAP domain-containing protein [Solirubrobacteraceae bacterium]|nr:CHAP domain-containing protein [Solirubrobacteraceae bacterium]
MAERVVAAARGELARNVHEMPDGSNEAPRIARYRNAVRWAAGPAAWCGYFVSFAARQAGVPVGDGGRGIGLVSEFRTWAQRTGRWRTSPHPGYAVVFRHAHVGVVERVTGSSVVTIEGNHANRVARVWRSRGEIRGYVRFSAPTAGELGDEEPWSPSPFRWRG